jgi:hypothetical protein
MKIEIEKLVAELNLQKSNLKKEIQAKRKRGLAVMDTGEVAVFDFCISELKKILKISSKRMLADEGECKHEKTHMSNSFITCSKCKKTFY